MRLAVDEEEQQELMLQTALEQEQPRQKEQQQLRLQQQQIRSSLCLDCHNILQDKTAPPSGVRLASNINAFDCQLDKV